MVLKGLLLVISGPSGAGKGTVCQALLKKKQNMYLSVSATTRQPRSGEIQGVNYWFKTKEEFEHLLVEDQFLEYARVYDNYYGTPRLEVEKALETGKDVILEIDIQGALQVKEKMPNSVLVFIVPPSLTELKTRLVNRGTDSAAEIEKRLKCVAEEIKYISSYGYIVINNTVNEAVGKVEAILIAEKCRPYYYDFAKYL
ncbi:guanylate kinase [Desulfofarcimen acetoxidans DSM 771]|jgi:guanylate kinase|uniref:Guanylate kinase n=1 Tax=Desulfofarcimen acetoxidans (strain ATCC 49208 / DSM 771 / KCTC 5769 / VKM B-1644 / 5575) TaxID=485916 RepID=C8W076_DESAS|nr:guanylate kinase [Desulfofarcimen acetoxidans]ACV63131.1 guanylate kinase [Desulfofarcimen acetoxidans DSM 771]